MMRRNNVKGDCRSAINMVDYETLDAKNELGEMWSRYVDEENECQ